MYPFSHTILKLLNDYKTIIRKHLTNEEWSNKIITLGLKRKMLRLHNEVALYQKAQAVIADITVMVQKDPNPPSWYSGLDEFCQFFKNTLGEYVIENDKVVNTSQEASRALVTAFQLMRSEAKVDKYTSQKLDKCGHVIAKYGSSEQQEMFSKALKEFQYNDINVFLPLLGNFEKYTQEFLSLNEEMA